MTADTDGPDEVGRQARRNSPEVELEGQEGERHGPVEEVGDDLNGGGLARVPEESAHESPELVVVGGGVADVPHGSVLRCRG